MNTFLLITPAAKLIVLSVDIMHKRCAFVRLHSIHNKQDIVR